MIIVASIFAILKVESNGTTILISIGAAFFLHYVVIKVISKGRVNYWDGVDPD